MNHLSTRNIFRHFKKQQLLLYLPQRLNFSAITIKNQLSNIDVAFPVPLYRHLTGTLYRHFIGTSPNRQA